MCASFRAVLVVVMSCLGAGVAAAQSSGPGDIAFSYSFVEVTEDGGFSVPAGWLLSAARSVHPRVAIVGEFGGSYTSDSGGTLGLHTIQGGVRVGRREGAGVRPFAQILAGVAVASCCGEYVARPVVEPGGGVDIPVGSRAMLRLGAGVPFTLGEGPTTMVRLHVGMAFGLGRQ